jgi:hypothetical protein
LIVVNDLLAGDAERLRDLADARIPLPDATALCERCRDLSREVEQLVSMTELAAVVPDALMVEAESADEHDDE